MMTLLMTLKNVSRDWNEIMDTKFDSKAAEQLLKQMSFYCTGIQREYKELHTIASDLKTWDDKQAVAFRENMKGIAEDLDKVLKSESDYMRTFSQRIKELRE